MYFVPVINTKQIKQLVDTHQYKDGNYLYEYVIDTLNENRKVDIKLFEYIEQKGNFNINSRADYYAN